MKKILIFMMMACMQAKRPTAAKEAQRREALPEERVLE